MDNILLQTYDTNYLELSWRWLNDPEIKKLTDTPAFTKEQQLSWFNSLEKKKDNYLIWGIAFGDMPIGVCGLKNITDYDCEYWGYIGEKSYWGRGIGKTIMLMLESIAMEKGLKSIWLKVLNTNSRAIKLYNKCGYAVGKETDIETIMRKTL